MKKICLYLISLLLSVNSLAQESYGDILISTPNTSLMVTGKQGEPLRFQYYGSRMSSTTDIRNSATALGCSAYPTFGIDCASEYAMQVCHADGDLSLDLYYVSHEQEEDADSRTWKFLLKDKIYPFEVKVCYKAYRTEDVIETWTEITHQEKKPVILYKFASAYFPVKSGNHWISHLHGSWAAESYLTEEQLTTGSKIIKNKDGVRNTQCDNPSFLLSIDGAAKEDYGHVIGGTLAWSGNYAIQFDIDYTRTTHVFAGINPDASFYKLAPKETLRTPELALTYSLEGKGGVSRNFHRWARKYKLAHGEQLRDILLNSWEGVYFDINQQGMTNMMKEFSDMGGELFVMDDGWFGNKYPRNNDTSSLGDWEVCHEKLPEGIEGLIADTCDNEIKFGIWIEPEMTNTVSELYEKHPDWIVCQKNRTPSTGRGGTQLVLDMSNPKVQDFVFGVVDNLMTRHPEIAYIKWDANMTLLNYGSHYLSADKQSHLYIDFHRGLTQVLKRIRQKYPDVVMQACASGGGRVTYGLLPYFDEFWTSDNTDALQRIYMQWGISNFFPAVAMASHVSAAPNHQTGRDIPLKFRFDVAMSGRLGMEIQPANLSNDEKDFAKKAIQIYKVIRPIIQQGDLYRLISPYEKRGVASLMYTSLNKEQAVFFVYKMEHFYGQAIPRFRMAGLQADAFYKLEEINQVKTNLWQHGQVISGKLLMEQGIDLPLHNEYASMVVKLTRVDK